jgi:hypothetical protein
VTTEELPVADLETEEVDVACRDPETQMVAGGGNLNSFEDEDEEDTDESEDRDAEAA